MAMSGFAGCRESDAGGLERCPRCGLDLGRLQSGRRIGPAGGKRGCDAPLPEKDADAVERRRHPRVEHRTLARVNGKAAMLFDVSRSGLKLSSPLHPPAGAVEVELDTGGGSLSLKGMVRWIGTRRSFSSLLDFGVEIIDPPPGYLDFVGRLQSAR
jgi:hypothetical protein